jgi:hypothetical protein
MLFRFNSENWRTHGAAYQHYGLMGSDAIYLADEYQPAASICNQIPEDHNLQPLHY